LIQFNLVSCFVHNQVTVILGFANDMHLVIPTDWMPIGYGGRSANDAKTTVPSRCADDFMQ